MGKEFKIIKELATVTATAAELAAINQIICSEIPSKDFHEEYDSLIADIRHTYEVVLATLQPLAELAEPESFADRFEEIHGWYRAQHQPALSEPRIYAEYTFEKYLQFRKRKEYKTGYPPLKAAFSRLHDLIDKWIDNDIWLAMSIDILFKQLNLFMDDVADARKRDPEEGLALYLSCIGSWPAFTAFIATSVAALPQCPAGPLTTDSVAAS